MEDLISPASGGRRPVKVLIAFNLGDSLLTKLQSCGTPTQIVAMASLSQLTLQQLGEAEVVLCRDFEPEQFTNCPNLRWIHKMSTGVDRMLYRELLESPVTLTNSAGAHAIPIAEHVIGVMLAIVKDLPKAFRDQLKHSWKKEHTRELNGLTVGLVGMGHVGAEITRMARAMSMTVLATRRRGIPVEGQVELFPREQLHEMLARSDFVVISLPLTADTQGYFGKAEFHAMRPDSYFINIARGQVVDEAALIEALQSGQIAGAALDVASKEPLPPDSPLWDMPNVIITPHTSGHSTRVSGRAVDLFCANLARYWRGETLINVVDKHAGY